MTVDQLTPMQLDEFFEAYVECALWSSMDDEGEPLDTYETSVFCHNTMLNDCRMFTDRNYDKLMEALEHSGYTLAQAGHDFWLTRNHHGAGYWDRGLGKVGDSLAYSAEVEGSVDLYVGDDGLVHCLGY